MNTERVWTDLREVADVLEFDEEPTVYLPDDPRELDELLARLSVIASAVRWLQAKARDSMGEHLGTRGFARFGPRVYRAAPDRKVKVRHDAVGELWEFIAPHARQLFNPHDARVGQLRTIGDGYVDPDTGEIGYDAFEARFYDVETGVVKVSEMPADNDRTPKYIKTAEEGVHWRE